MKSLISFSDWEKCDVRVGTILTIEDHPKADKLYVLQVTFGEEIGTRTIVAGLKAHYKKDELHNKQGVFIINLEPVTLRGIRSEGMTLAGVSSDDSCVCILNPEKELPDGSIIR